MGKQPQSEVFFVPMETMYAALQRSVAERGYTVVVSNPEAGVVSFNTGRSMSTFAGQDLTATLIQEAPDRTRMVIGGSLATRGSPFGGGSQIVAWGEKDRLIERVLDDVAKLVNAPPGWNPDPYGRFDGRWWDGRRWTDHVGRIAPDGTRDQMIDPP